MTFDEALEKLRITDLRNRIWNSNSHGELFHLGDYIAIAEHAQDDELRMAINGELIRESVSFAESNWSNPEHVFQHMPKMLNHYFTQLAESSKQPRFKNRLQPGMIPAYLKNVTGPAKS